LHVVGRITNAIDVKKLAIESISDFEVAGEASCGERQPLCPERNSNIIVVKSLDKSV
jgi:hypothetical protein